MKQLPAMCQIIRQTTETNNREPQLQQTSDFGTVSGSFVTYSRVLVRSKKQFSSQLLRFSYLLLSKEFSIVLFDQNLISVGLIAQEVGKVAEVLR